ncbi:MAG TPA: SAM-dependent methyltransferase [Leptospiraceae bacterium]|nr:SAM-dependent methyltransferase [Leptospiraceae bacterium]
MQKEKIRLDELLVRRNFAPDLKRAASLILSGSVLISDSPVTKPGFRFKEDADIRIREKIKNHSSRGYLKLKPVMEKFGISVRGRVCIDIGASTGGFTEILLEGNAERESMHWMWGTVSWQKNSERTAV